MSSHSGSNLQKQTFQRFIPIQIWQHDISLKGYELKFKLYLFDSRWNHQKFTVQIESYWLKENLCKESHCWKIFPPHFGVSFQTLGSMCTLTELKKNRVRFNDLSHLDAELAICPFLGVLTWPLRNGQDTVDGSEIRRSPVDVGKLCHYLEAQVVQDFFHQQYYEQYEQWISLWYLTFGQLNCKVWLNRSYVLLNLALNLFELYSNF